MAGDKPLTAKQQAFVSAYLSNGRRGAEAYRQAYNTNMAPARVAEEASKLLRHPKIAPIIAAAQEKADAAVAAAVDRYGVSRERNIAELARIAYANIEDYTRLIDGERFVDLSAAGRDELAAVQEIIVEDFKDRRDGDAREVKRTRVKLGDKQGAIERINRMMGWNIDRAEVGAPGDFANLSDAALDEKIVEGLTKQGMSEAEAHAFLGQAFSNNEPQKAAPTFWAKARVH